MAAACAISCGTVKEVSPVLPIAVKPEHPDGLSEQPELTTTQQLKTMNMTFRIGNWLT